MYALSVHHLAGEEADSCFAGSALLAARVRYFHKLCTLQKSTACQNQKKNTFTFVCSNLISLEVVPVRAWADPESFVGVCVCVGGGVLTTLALFVFLLLFFVSLFYKYERGQRSIINTIKYRT